jgi:hypothetical protein
MRKLIWAGIVVGLIPIYMGSACGGYTGWMSQDTSGVDAKINEEVSVTSSSPLESGLWTYYANYNNDIGPGMSTISSYVDHAAPAGLFTTDGLGTQHFNTHVGTAATVAYDKDKDGAIGWQGSGISNDYSIANGFCPAVGGTGSSAASNGFSAYCTKGQWETLIGTSATTETKQKASGTGYNNSKAGNYLPINVAQVLATSTPLPAGSAGVMTTVTAITLPGGISHTMTTPIGANVYGFGSAISINANQAGLVEAANWLAQQWAGQPDGFQNVTLTFNGAAGASLSFQVASGRTASAVMANFAATH